ncbi:MULTISPECIES: pyruvate, water dikinase regulatory protein [Paenibacillus]|uniref:Putative pyruvate, phosphate dikinase regulatory protein n=1 Tax=Paenibacillus borealis TaxID=160799 RepID=A0ABX3GX22_PAEBO|nr:pyruvate, water dikinase regulatory protein [Paenibacillus borealis]OMD39625.1 phosphoenolpyruvate synthase regulatory protein [Paenibacillus borealis]
MFKQRQIFICSDSACETADRVVRAAMQQFDLGNPAVRRFKRINSEQEIAELVQLAHTEQSFIAYTLVQPGLREAIQREGTEWSVDIVDIMGPMMETIKSTFKLEPLMKPGLLYDMNADYYRRIEAIEFAVKYDDGRDPRGLLLADIVLIGVSRTSKTPLSMYMAYKGYKVANWPLVPGVKPPMELWQIRKHRLFALTMDIEALIKIRTERLRMLGLGAGASYVSELQVLEEYNEAEALMKSLRCPVIDVTSTSIEESADLIMECMVQERFQDLS